jgi:hypothetical protein
MLMPCPFFFRSISHSRSASFGLSPTTSRNEHTNNNNNSTHVSIREDEDENEHDNDNNNYNNEPHENTRNHDTNNDDENEDDQDRDQSDDSDDSEGAMSLIFANTPRATRPTSMDEAVGTTGRRPRREGRFSMGPAPRERDDDGDGDGDGLVDMTLRPTPGRPAGMGVRSPGTSPNKRAVRKTGSGMRGAAVTHERIASPNGSGNGITRGSTSTIRPFSRLSTSSTSRPRVGSTTETHACSARPNGTGRASNRPTNLSMSINTDRQQAKFAGRLRFPHGHGHGNGSEGRESPISPTSPSSMTSGSARPSTKIAPKTTATAKTTMTMTNGTKAPSARPGVGPGGQASVGRKERMEKGKALVLPKAPGGRI